MALRALGLTLLLLSLNASAIEIKWTPADGDGPEPASQRYREQAVSETALVRALRECLPITHPLPPHACAQARLRELQGEETVGQHAARPQASAPQPGLLGA